MPTLRLDHRSPGIERGRQFGYLFGAGALLRQKGPDHATFAAEHIGHGAHSEISISLSRGCSPLTSNCTAWVKGLSPSGRGGEFGAPKGIGALFVPSRLTLEPVLHGGGQERGARSGTENVAGAVGLAAAIAHGRGGFALDGATTSDDFIARVLARVPGAILTGHPIDRLPAHASFCFTGTSGEAVLLELERRGVVCSSGSACAAGSDAPSHVLLAMGIESTVAQTAVRFTWSTDVTPGDFETAADAALDSVLSVRGLARA